MYLRSSTFAVILFFSGLFLIQNDSDARKRGIVFINFANETISELKDATMDDGLYLANLTKDSMTDEEYKAFTSMVTGKKVAYKYTYCGAFWLELWTWGGEVVIYDPAEEMYYTVEVPQKEAAAKYGKPFFFSFPPLLIGGLLFGGFWLWGLKSQGKSQAEINASTRPSGGARNMPVPQGVGGGTAPKPAAPQYTTEQLQELYDDPRYQHALQLLEQTNSFQQPVEYLIQNGVPDAEAGASLAALKKAVAEAQED